MPLILNSTLSGTSTNAVTASYAKTASFVDGTVISASYAISASYVSGSVQVETGSLVLTSSFNEYTSSGASIFSGTASLALTASFLSGSIESASYAASASFAQTSSYALTASFLSGSIESASYALTASYALNSATGAYATTGSNTFTGRQTFAFSGSLSAGILLSGSNATGTLPNIVWISASLMSIKDFRIEASTFFDELNNDLGISFITNAETFAKFGLTTSSIDSDYLDLSKAQKITGSTFEAIAFSGSLYGTSSWATTSLTASFVSGTASLALTASYFSGSISNAISASFASTASYFSGSISNAISASYALTASYALNGGGTGLPNRFILSGSDFTVNEGLQATIYDLYNYGTFTLQAGTVSLPLGLIFITNNPLVAVEDQLYNSGIINNGGIIQYI